MERNPPYQRAPARRPRQEQEAEDTKLNRVWLYWLPLLFLPSVNLATSTAFGTLTVSDYLIGPYLVLVAISLRHSPTGNFAPVRRLWVRYLIPTMLWFLWWAVISTLSMYFRFSYADQTRIMFGLLKLAKLSLYVVAAVLTMYALARLNPSERRQFDWVMTAIGLLTGLTLLISGNEENALVSGSTAASSGQVFTDNPISVLMAILLAFLAGKVIDESQPSPWRHATIATLVIMVFGLVIAEGRGGWLAAAAGAAYIGFRRMSWSTVRYVLAGVVLLVIAYHQIPTFRELVDRTIQPDQAFLQDYNAGVMGLDDGARFSILQSEAPKLLDDPILGRGIFHRGGLSGLFSTGSHNFFVQIFLETGLVGGLLVLALAFQMWRHASSFERDASGLALPTKAAIVAAIIAGLSGEYFYGGTALLVLLLTYVPVGSLPVVRHRVIKPRNIPQLATHDAQPIRSTR